MEKINEKLVKGKERLAELGRSRRSDIPVATAWKGAKWVKDIISLPADHPGFWEVRGYSNTADPWTEDRFS